MIDHPSNRCDGRSKLHPSLWQPRHPVRGHFVPIEAEDGPTAWFRASERFWPSVDLLGPCWVWTGYKVQGYGRFSFRRESWSTHIWAYEYLIGPVPEGKHLDHACHDPKLCKGGPTCPHRACVNPAHLEPVTPRENALRARRGEAPDEFCLNGHPWDAKNTYVRASGWRVCRACNAERMRRVAAEKRARVHA